MNPIVTVTSQAVVHHIDVSKIADIRHEPNGNRATLFFSAGGEVVVMFRDSAALGQFVEIFKAANGGGRR